MSRMVIAITVVSAIWCSSAQAVGVSPPRTPIADDAVVRYIEESPSAAGFELVVDRSREAVVTRGRTLARTRLSKWLMGQIRQRLRASQIPSAFLHIKSGDDLMHELQFRRRGQLHTLNAWPGTFGGESFPAATKRQMKLFWFIAMVARQVVATTSPPPDKQHRVASGRDPSGGHFVLTASRSRLERRLCFSLDRRNGSYRTTYDNCRPRVRARRAMWAKSAYDCGTKVMETVGTLGPSIARVQVVMTDGTSRDAQIYPSPPAVHYKGRFFLLFTPWSFMENPREVNAYDGAGRLAATKKFNQGGGEVFSCFSLPLPRPPAPRTP